MQHVVCASLEIPLSDDILKPVSCAPGEKPLFPPDNCELWWKWGFPVQIRCPMPNIDYNKLIIYVDL